MQPWYMLERCTKALDTLDFHLMLSSFRCCELRTTKRNEKSETTTRNKKSEHNYIMACGVAFCISNPKHTRQTTHTPRSPHTHVFQVVFVSSRRFFRSFSFDHHSSFVKNFFWLLSPYVYVCACRFCFLFFNPYEHTSLQTNNGNVIFPLHSLPSAMWQILVSLFCAFFFSFDVVEIADNTIGAVVEVEVWLQCLGQCIIFYRFSARGTHHPRYALSNQPNGLCARISPRCSLQ